MRLMLDVGWVKLWRDPTFTGGANPAVARIPVDVGSREVLDPTYVQLEPDKLAMAKRNFPAEVARASTAGGPWGSRTARAGPGG